MKDFFKTQWKVLATCLALVLSMWFLLDPGPYPMALFTFVAQPLFAVAILAYLLDVWRDLRRRKVL